MTARAGGCVARLGAWRLSWLALSLLGLLAPALAHAREIPVLKAHVTDEAGLLGARARALEEKLDAYERQTGHQFAVLTLASLEGDVIEDFAVKTFEKTTLGDKKRDDGLLLVVARDDRKVRIEVGYGLEGEVTDAFTAGVIREVLTPAFRAGRFADGIERALDLLMAKGAGIAVGLPTARRVRDGSSLIPFVVFGIVALIVLSRFFGGGGGGGGRRRRRGGVVFLPGGFGGGWGGGFSGGGGGWGGGGWSGGGGGDWGGGGGSSGGGGASGDW